jgi:hypothetical protein
MFFYIVYEQKVMVFFWNNYNREIRTANMSNYTEKFGISYINVSSNDDLSEDADSVLVGNGKICLYPSYTEIDTMRSLITTASSTVYDTQYRNTIDGFSLNHVQFYDENNSNIPMKMSSMSLDITHGIFTGVFTESNNTPNFKVSYDLYSCRHNPFAVVQTIKFEALSSTIPKINFKHDVYTGNNIYNVSYTSSKIADTLNGVYVFTGQGIVQPTNFAIAFASSYIYDNTTPKFDNIGFNANRSYGTYHGYNQFSISNIVPGANTDTNKFSIVSMMMTNDDFTDPYQKITKMLLNLVSPSRVNVNKIRSSHSSGWHDLWLANRAKSIPDFVDNDETTQYFGIDIRPKSNASDGEKNEVMEWRRRARFALYNIFSSIRESAVILSPLSKTNINAADIFGTISMDGDLWLMPLLIMLNAPMAKSILEYRSRTLSQAIESAAAYGGYGAKYDYVNTNYPNEPGIYWDISSPLYIFNNALIAINVWNYYRVTSDKEWFSSKGYAIMKNTVDFCISRSDYNKLYDKYQYIGVAGLNTANSESMTNNSMTCYFARLAVKYAIEASYELTMSIDDKWHDFYYKIDMTMGSQDNVATRNIILLDETATNTTKIDILETMLPLLPVYSYLVYNSDPIRNHQDIVSDNLDYYSSSNNHITAEYESLPQNVFLQATLSAVAMQYELAAGSYDRIEIGFKERINDFFGSSSNVTPIWGNLKRPNEMKDGRQLTYNDATISAMFLTTIMSGVCGLNIMGGVAESRFYYEPFGIADYSGVVGGGMYNKSFMPETWSAVTVWGVGRNNTAMIMTNARLL